MIMIIKKLIIENEKQIQKNEEKRRKIETILAAQGDSVKESWWAGDIGERSLSPPSTGGPVEHIHWMNTLP